MEGSILAPLLVALFLQNTDGFQWTPKQLSSQIVNSYNGTNAKLPCHFQLSREEKDQLQQFNVILWSKETPFGSQRWEGVASATHISGLNQSLPEMLSPNSNKYTFNNNTLTIYNVGYDDDTQYQCEVKSSFYASPSVIKVNVVYKPYGTKIFGPTDTVKHKATTLINCTAKANPKPGFSFYHNNKLIQNSTLQHYMINTTLAHHEGEYTCIPWNYYGHGSNASITVKVEEVKLPKQTLLSDGIIAGITGAVVLVIIIIIVAAIMCQRHRSDKQEMNSTAKNTSKNLNESHLGPAMYGSDGSIATSMTRSRDLNEAYVGPGIYGSDPNIDQSNESSIKPEPAIYKLNRPNIYGTDSDFSQSNGTYTPSHEHKNYKLNGSPNGYPGESNL